MSEVGTERVPVAATIVGVLGVILYALTGVLYLGSGLVVPAPWYLVLWAIWLLGLYPLYRVFQKRRAWTFLVALLAAGAWYGIVTAGEYFLDWTA